ncbi:MAG: hypothetical protein GF390_00620 [Candidatus Pacebacteria bacterium]|nr:hypothetical protein [Candidatus Paceibacterota bacterium]
MAKKNIKASPEVASDQTLFASQEPLLEDQVELAKATSPQPLDVQAPWWKRKLTLITAVILLVLIAVIGLLIAMANQQQQNNTPPASTSITSDDNTASDPWQQKIDQLEAQLKAADPAPAQLPFPPVDLKIGL